MQSGPDDPTGLDRASGIRVGTDLVQVSRIAESIAAFGGKFTRRLFTEREIAYSTSSEPLQAARFAKRFAAKEATIKVLDLTQVGFDWKHIEVVRAGTGHCTLALSGAAREAAEQASIRELSVSLSRDGDYATAVVVALTVGGESNGIERE